MCQPVYSHHTYAPVPAHEKAAREEETWLQSVVVKKGAKEVSWATSDSLENAKEEAETVLMPADLLIPCLCLLPWVLGGVNNDANAVVRSLEWGQEVDGSVDEVVVQLNSTADVSWEESGSLLRRLHWRLTHSEEAAMASLCLGSLLLLLTAAVLKTRLWTKHTAPALPQFHDPRQERLELDSASNLLASLQRWQAAFARRLERLKRKRPRKSRPSPDAEQHLIRLSSSQNSPT